MLYRLFKGLNRDPIEEADRFLQKLEAAGDIARSTLRQHSTELSVVTRIYYQGPEEPMDHLGFHMTRAFIEKLQSFELEFDIDQYVVTGEAVQGSNLPSR
jgi:hypothetical protein